MKTRKPREDWVTRNLREKEDSGEVKAFAKGRVGAIKGVPHSWSNKGQSWKRKTTENWKGGGKPKLDPNWPGPFEPRTDFPGLTRNAYWLNCTYCNVLFCRSVTWVKSRKKGRAGHGTGGNATFCSIACGKHMQVKPSFRVCAYCAKTFRVWANNRHKRTCCDDCMRMVMSEHRTTKARMPLVVYAFEHGVEASYEDLSCEGCGATQRKTDKDKNSRNTHWFVRIAEVEGRYVARCKKCYEKAVTARKKAEAAMTPGQKLRQQEAQELIRSMKK